MLFRVIESRLVLDMLLQTQTTTKKKFLKVGWREFPGLPVIRKVLSLPWAASILVGN